MTIIMQNEFSGRQQGFSLIELMVGLVIGLLASLVIMQVFSLYEGQKRATTGGADAQTSAGLALYTIQREGMMAGYGIPTFSTKNPALNCDPLPTFDHDGNATTADAGLFPVSITDGGSGSDTLVIRYGDTKKGGVPVTSTIAANTVTLNNNLGCEVNDIALVVSGTVCAMQKVTALSTTTPYTSITLQGSPTSKDGIVMTSGNIACMGPWNEVSFEVKALGGESGRLSLLRNGVPVAPNVVAMQAQYGVTDAPGAAGNDKITSWVDATGDFQTAATTPNISNRRRIRAVRVALIVRNGQYEKDNVTTACSVGSPKASQPCIWRGDTTPTAVDLSGLTDWQHYRYGVYETIIPMRNLVWAY